MIAKRSPSMKMLFYIPRIGMTVRSGHLITVLLFEVRR
jgi:hypothetical protein